MNALESAVRKAKRGLGLSSDSLLVRSVRPAYDSLLNAVYGRAGLKRQIHGEPSIRFRPRYRAVAEDFEFSVFTTLKSHIAEGGVVLDVGANIGMYSILFARWVGATGHVYSFEPAPESLQALHDHVSLNDLTDRIDIIGQAVSDEIGEATFYAHSASGENSLNPHFAQRVAGAGAVRVPVTTIDEFCTARGIRPSLIKIDIEGFEFSALRGARETLKKCRPTVIVELHPHIWPEIGLTRDEAMATLSDLNCEALQLEKQVDPLTEFGHVRLRYRSGG